MPPSAGAAWNRDGVIVFSGEAGRGLSRVAPLMAVDVSVGAAIATGEPRQLFRARMKRTWAIAGSYDVTQDGKRFRANITSGDETAAPITLVLNWSAALRR
jgi:hypothetical protein